MCLIKRIMKKINSIELGRLCGVSQGTVYRALHNKGRVKEETRQRVLEMAKKHNYRANPLANEMIRGKSNLVGVVLPFLDASFYMDLLNIIQKKLADSGFILLIATAEDDTSMIKILDEFSVRRFNSVIIIPSHESHKIPKNIYDNLKLISLVNPVSHSESILPNELQCGSLGTEILINKNHKKIVRICGEGSGWAIKERNKGYIKTMEKNNLTPIFLKVHHICKPQKDISLLENQLTQIIEEENPTAFFCHNDSLANKIINSLGRLGFKIPEDISVLGTDANSGFLQMNPHIDSLIYPMEEISEHCVSFITGKETKNRPKAVFKIYAGNTVNKI